MPGAVAGATLLTRELLPAAGSAGPEADGAEPASGGGDLER
jgi:hypothetical protein